MTCEQSHFPSVKFATKWHERLIGLLFTPESKFTGLAIKPCSSIHTIGMRYPIDVVFVDGDNHITRIHKSVKPFRICFGGKGTHFVVELPAGSADENSFEPGKKLNFLETAQPQNAGGE